MRRIGWMFLLGLLLTGCGVSPATQPSEATLPPAPSPILPTPTGAAPVGTIMVSPDSISIVLPGYWATCSADPKLSIPVADGWKPLENYIQTYITTLNLTN
jgi:hypothetical protein